MKDYKIAIIGTPDTVLGFKGLGVHVHGVTSEEQGHEVITSIMSSDTYAVLLITEDWLAKLESSVQKFHGQALPAVLPIPSQKGSTGEAARNISKIVEQAVGSDILG